MTTEHHDLRARLCRAEVVRQLLPVAMGRLDLEHALDWLNVTLNEIGGVEITGLVADDLDASIALGTDLPDPAGRILIERWQGALDSRDHVAHVIEADDQVFIPAVHNRRIVGYATATPTDHLDPDIAIALQDALGETIRTAQAYAQS